MNVLESPVEALALNYLSHCLLSAVNSVWTWVAVITAAVSLWKIRPTSLRYLSRLPEPSLCQASTMTNPSEVHEACCEKPAAVILTAGEKTSLDCMLERELSSKVKFTLYYSDDDHFRQGDDEDSGGVAGRSENLGWRCDDLKRMMMMRMGDMGWYQCQDLSVLDGSVVRLWDVRGQRRVTATATW